MIYDAAALLEKEIAECERFLQVLKDEQEQELLLFTYDTSGNYTKRKSAFGKLKSRRARIRYYEKKIKTLKNEHENIVKNK